MTELKVPENGAICGISTITNRASSHTYGWARTWAENLGVGINHACEHSVTVFLDHGVNYGGSLNLFSGYTEKHSRCIQNLVESENVYSLDIDMPRYDEMFSRRKDVDDPKLMAKLTEFCDRAITLKSTDLKTDWLTIGDSHVAAWAPHGSMIVRENGRTLNSQVKTDFEWIREHLALCPQIRGVTIVLGNIDIRHHIIRLNADWQSMWAALHEFGESLDIEVEIASPWPVEFEGRKVPKSGWYKGQPFWGSQAERSDVVKKVVTDSRILRYPSEWLEMDPEVYAKERMEKPQSVHLSPAYYRRQGWSS